MCCVRVFTAGLSSYTPFISPELASLGAWGRRGAGLRAAAFGQLLSFPRWHHCFSAFP